MRKIIDFCTFPITVNSRTENFEVSYKKCLTLNKH